MRAIGLLAAIFALFSVVVTAQGAMPFKCQPGEGGICACSGAGDCKDMRKSGMCAGTLTCKTMEGVLICNCTAARSKGGIAKQPPASTAKQKQ